MSWTVYHPIIHIIRSPFLITNSETLGWEPLVTTMAAVRRSPAYPLWVITGRHLVGILSNWGCVLWRGFGVKPTARAIRGLFNGDSYEDWTTGLIPALDL